jgi:hypothetical protein
MGRGDLGTDWKEEKDERMDRGRLTVYMKCVARRREHK